MFVFGKNSGMCRPGFFFLFFLFEALGVWDLMFGGWRLEVGS